MNKKLFLLPFLSLSLLIGCGKKGGDNPPPEKDIWELDEVEGESTIAEVKAGEAGQYYTVRGTVIANSGSTLGIYRKGQFLYCYNFNADPANNGGQENLKAHPLGSYVEIHAQSSTHGGAVQLTAYDVGTDKTDKKYDRAASLEVLATQGETVAPVEITKPEDFTNAEGAGKLMKFSFVPDKDYTLKDESTDQYINGTICETKTNLKLEKYCDAAVRTALLANNTTSFEDHATYEVIAFGAATTDGPARGVLCEGSSWRKTADAHFDDPESVILEAPDEATSVEAGKTLQLQFMVMPKTAKQEVTWTSSNDEVASVSSSGLVTGVAASATPVTITAATVANPAITGTYQLTVTEPVAAPVALPAGGLNIDVAAAKADEADLGNNSYKAAWSGKRGTTGFDYTLSNNTNLCYAAGAYKESGALGIDCFQAKKELGVFMSIDSRIVAASKVTITMYATYDSEAAKYLPTVRVGTSETDITANELVEGAAAYTADTGKKDGNYEIYSYVLTYDVTVSNATLSIVSATGGAVRFSSILIEA